MVTDRLLGMKEYNEGLDLCWGEDGQGKMAPWLLLAKSQRRRKAFRLHCGHTEGQWRLILHVQDMTMKQKSANYRAKPHALHRTFYAECLFFRPLSVKEIFKMIFRQQKGDIVQC